MAQLVSIARLEEVPPGQSRVIKVGEFGIALFNIEGTFYALENSCPHSGGPLGRGELQGKIVTCPWHEWRFDVTTGLSIDYPDEQAKRFEVKIEGGEIKVLL
jgi:nitrite reductase/ring-hydroxylating ferredoxin subunit